MDEFAIPILLHVELGFFLSGIAPKASKEAKHDNRAAVQVHSATSPSVSET